MKPLLIWTTYVVPLALTSMFHLYRRRRREMSAVAVLEKSVENGMTEPPSLHPVVDQAQCCGAGACIKACHEQALGIINGKAHLVNPTLCIGHGACADACPVEAIKVVDKGTGKQLYPEA